MNKKEEFRILTARSHVQERIGMYMGSASVEEVQRFVMGKWQTVKYVPALSKMIDEILDNSIDEAIRTNFEHANLISVSVNGNQIIVEDNGRGIPQDQVFDEVAGEQIPRPVAAWTKVNAGTSFDDSRVTIGTNGVGSAATNFLSESFIGETWDGSQYLKVQCTDGALHVDIQRKKKKSAATGTRVSFTPNFTFFETDSLNKLDTLKLLEDRLLNLQMSFPEIKFLLNKKRVSTPDLKKYASMFTDSNDLFIEKSSDVSFFLCGSSDGFRTNSFVNGVNTRQGGSHIDYIVNGILDELVILIQKKHKIDITKSTVKNGLTFVLFLRNFKNPKFDSQTKERLTNPISAIKQKYEEQNLRDFKTIAKKLFAINELIEPIIEAQLAKKLAAEKRAATLAQRKLSRVRVAKHVSANSPNATLKIVEGDSAMGFLLKVRDPNKIGAYPLRGVIMNTWEMKPSDILKNKELSELISILNLDINDPESVDNLSYEKIAILTDADQDGAGHISPLLLAFFYRFWPRLFSEKRVMITRTPIMISSLKKDVKWFYTYNDAGKFKKEVGSNWYHRYIKGLGSLQEDEYAEIINNPKYDVVSIDDSSLFDMMFAGNSTPRKEFMMGDKK